MLTEKLKNFSHPGKEFRGAPFWAWNGLLRPEKLCEQIRTMKKMGFGGFYMHSRTGLATSYLSKEWFECISACVAEAEKLDMEPWLYDEDRWPSGTCGGQVTANDEYKARKLRSCEGEAPEPDKMLVRFALQVTGSKILSMRRLKAGENPAPDETLYSFYWEFMECSSWFNGNCYLDTLNPEATQTFLNSTHEEYFRRYGDKFGKSIPGIFSDEPCYIHGDVTQCLPWTGKLPEKFKNAYSYDLLDYLPELFFDTEREISRARYDYYALITRLFAGSFSRPIAEWCKKHNLQMTGHVLGEDLLSTQILYVGSAMPFYEYMQQPGVDILTEHWNVFNTVKQCTSVAHQQGSKRCLTESYACTGWDFPFSGYKAIGDWQYAMGVNRRCLHLAWYSMEAEGKRDYPASISSHSPWFGKFSVLEDYFARLSALICDGNPRRDILVIHPIGTLWGIMIKDIPSTDIEQERRQIKPGTKALEEFYSEKVNILDRAHTALTNLLLQENLDFDFGDEYQLRRHASVKDTCFRVGKAEYSMVLLPEMKTICSSTLELLQQFNGPVFYLGSPPEYVDAMPSSAAKKIYSLFIQATRENLTQKISSIFRRVSIQEPAGNEASCVLYRLADCSDHDSFFLCNTAMPFRTELKTAPLARDRRTEYPELTVTLHAARQGELYECDLHGSAIWRVSTERSGDTLNFKTSLHALQSRMYLLTEDELAVSPRPEEPRPGKLLQTLPPPVDFRLSEENVLVLDQPRWNAKGQSHDAEYILFIDDHLREMLGQPPRGGLMCQPYCAQTPENPPKLDLLLEYTFGCDALPETPVDLVMEHPENFQIKLNGWEIPIKPAGFWLDEVMQRLTIPENFFQLGENTLTMTSKYDCTQRGLESVFLLGHFGVRQGNLTSFPKQLHYGDWCQDGLENYAGNLTYEFEIDLLNPVLLTFGEWRGSLLGVSVNDEAEKLLIVPPFQAKLPAGLCRLKVTVYGHRRNAMGPFHLKEKWPIRTGPHQYKMYETAERQLVPCGLLEAPKLYEILQDTCIPEIIEAKSAQLQSTLMS